MSIIERSFHYNECNSNWEPTWLAEPFLMHEGVTIIHAEPKARKSTFRAHLIACCMAGVPIAGHWPIQKKVKSCLVVIGEENKDAEATRIADAVRALGLDPQPLMGQQASGDVPLRIVPPISDVWLDDDDYIEAFAQEMDLYDIDLLVLDPLTGFHRGVENDADAMARVCAGIRRLAQKSSVLVIHHDAKLDPGNKRKSGDRMRGSSVLRGAYDLGIEIRGAGPDTRELHFETRYTPPVEPQLVRVRYDARCTRWSWLGEKDLAVELRDYLKAQGGGWVTASRLEMEVPHPIMRVKHVLESMTLQGECVHLNGDGKPERWKLVGMN